MGDERFMVHGSRFTEPRNYGFTEPRNYGTADLRIYGATKLRKNGTRIYGVTDYEVFLLFLF